MEQNQNDPETIKQRLHDLIQTDQIQLCWQYLQQHVDYLNLPISGTGMTLLHLAATYKRLELVKALIANQAEPNTIDNLGRTPLHYACANGNEEIVKEFIAIKERINFDHQTLGGETPVMKAAEFGNLRVLGLLLANKLCNVQITNKLGQNLFDVLYCHNKPVYEDLKKQCNENQVFNEYIPYFKH